jgi:hypothetical protein
LIAIVIPTWTNTWNKKIVATPTGIRTPKRSLEMLATGSIRQMREILSFYCAGSGGDEAREVVPAA